MGISSAMGPDALQPGLVLVKSQTVGTAVSSVTVSDAFNATYDNYKITYTGGTGSTTTSLRLRFGSTATAYYMLLTFAAPTATAFTFLGTDNQAQFNHIGSSHPSVANINLDVFRPFASAQTSISGFYMREDLGGVLWGHQRSNTSFTDFTVIVESGTITGGTIRVYGYRN